MTAACSSPKASRPARSDRLQETYKAILSEGLDRLKQLGFTPKARLVIGDRAEQIGAFAREIGADLVVVGHRKQKLFQRWVVRLLCRHLVDHLGCSLLIGRNTISERGLRGGDGEGQRALGRLDPPDRARAIRATLPALSRGWAFVVVAVFRIRRPPASG